MAGGNWPHRSEITLSQGGVLSLDELPGASQHAQSKGPAYDRPFFSDGGTRQVDHQSLALEGQPGVLEGSLDAVLQYLNSFIGRPMMSIRGSIDHRV
jgi:hypothetical protein